MLDNSVAGGIAGGTSAFNTLVKEAAEEASLDPELVRKRAHAVGAVSYYYRTKARWLQPEVQFVYDMRVEPGEVKLARARYVVFLSPSRLATDLHAHKFSSFFGAPWLLDFGV